MNINSSQVKRMKKIKTRLQAIQTLIKNQEIEDQETLVDLLEKEYNIETNQSIISRDLRALGVVKRSIGNRQLYETGTIDVSKEILRLCIVTVEHNEVMIIIKTLPGLAAFVADYLDVQKNSGILGTLSGENVVFIIPESIKNIKKTFKIICTHVYFKQKSQKE